MTIAIGQSSLHLDSLFYFIRVTASEVYRQAALLDSGNPVPQETRGFDEQRGETFKLRSKEDAPDYRYMPDPNLPPLLLTEVCKYPLAIPFFPITNGWF